MGFILLDIETEQRKKKIVAVDSELKRNDHVLKRPISNLDL